MESDEEAIEKDGDGVRQEERVTVEDALEEGEVAEEKLKMSILASSDNETYINWMKEPEAPLSGKYSWLTRWDPRDQT